MPRVDVVIPTKSNQSGLTRLLSQLSPDPVVENIIVVCDGPNAYDWVSALPLSNTTQVVQVPLASGIHVMWNLGMETVKESGNHVCFINDDVSIDHLCMANLAEFLNANDEYGLVTPNFTEHVIDGVYQTTAFAGFCIMLSSALTNEYRFDERMVWWYGDNDIITWVDRVAKKRTGLVGSTKCSENQSFTIRHDPPPDFHNIIQRDAQIFNEKWNNG